MGIRVYKPTSPGRRGASVSDFARSQIRYHLSLPRPALVIENEVYSRGWRGRLSTGESIEPVEVSGGLRGWRLPAGDYDLEVVFTTPLLPLGLTLSCIAAVAYGACIVAESVGSRRGALAA